MPKTKSPLLPQPGFTIVELITVIILLGILGAVAIPRFNGLGLPVTAMGDFISPPPRSAGAQGSTSTKRPWQIAGAT